MLTRLRNSIRNERKNSICFIPGHRTHCRTFAAMESRFNNRSAKPLTAKPREIASGAATANQKPKSHPSHTNWALRQRTGCRPGRQRKKTTLAGLPANVVPLPFRSYSNWPPAPSTASWTNALTLATSSVLCLSAISPGTGAATP